MAEEKRGMKAKVQRFGSYLSGMVMPNIGAFIAWGVITALFIGTGWWPNEQLAQLLAEKSLREVIQSVTKLEDDALIEEIEKAYQKNK